MPLFDLKTLFQRSVQPKAPPFPLLDLSKARTGADVLAAIEVVKAEIEAKNV